MFGKYFPSFFSIMDENGGCGMNEKAPRTGMRVELSI
jgi:hypothetical protein